MSCRRHSKCNVWDTGVSTNIRATSPLLSTACSSTGDITALDRMNYNHIVGPMSRDMGVCVCVSLVAACVSQNKEEKLRMKRSFHWTMMYWVGRTVGRCLTVILSPAEVKFSKQNNVVLSVQYCCKWFLSISQKPGWRTDQCNNKGCIT